MDVVNSGMSDISVVFEIDIQYSKMYKGIQIRLYCGKEIINCINIPSTS